MKLSRTARANAKNYADAKNAVIARTWKVAAGTCVLRQRPSGKWEAEFTSHDDEEYIVTLASTPKKAIQRLEIDATPVNV